MHNPVNSSNYRYCSNYYTPMTTTDYFSRSYQEQNHQVLNVINASIKREAALINLYGRLVNIAPNQAHKNDIRTVLANKKGHLNQFVNLYQSITGLQPSYEIEEISFESYRDGLQKAYDAGLEAYEVYRNYGYLSQNPLAQSLFFQASIAEKEIATRFEMLNNEFMEDYGSKPFVVDMEKVTKQNNVFRTALWTGEYLQLTLMSIDVGDDIGLEVHHDHDQFIRIEDGQGLVRMGDSRERLNYEEQVFADYAIFIPAGKWHNLINTGNKPIKLYSIYAPPEHPFGTVHETKAIATAAEENHH